MSDDPSISAISQTIKDSNLAALSESESSGRSLFLGYFCLIAVVFLAVLYLSRYSGGFDSNVYLESSEIAEEIVALGGSSGDGGEVIEVVLDPIKNGEKVFQLTCMACHQVNGQGLPPSFPPLAESKWLAQNPQFLARIVLYGLQGPITVKGTEFNFIMAPLGAALSDEQIAHALTYVRQEWGNSASAVDPAVVTTARAETGDRGPWTIEELAEWID